MYWPKDRVFRKGDKDNGSVSDCFKTRMVVVVFDGFEEDKGFSSCCFKINVKFMSFKGFIS